MRVEDSFDEQTVSDVDGATYANRRVDPVGWGWLADGSMIRWERAQSTRYIHGGSRVMTCDGWPAGCRKARETMRRTAVDDGGQF